MVGLAVGWVGGGLAVGLGEGWVGWVGAGWEVGLAVGWEGGG